MSFNGSHHKLVTLFGYAVVDSGTFKWKIEIISLQRSYDEGPHLGIIENDTEFIEGNKTSACWRRGYKIAAYDDATFTKEKWEKLIQMA